MNAISKKLLSFVIVLAMVLSMAPVITLPAAAAETTVTQADIDAWITANDSKFVDYTSATPAANRVVSAPCPICSPTEDVTWTCILTGSSPAANAHAYLNSNHKTHSNMNFMTNAGQRCLYLNGANTTIQGQLRLYSTGTVNIFGEGSITRGDNTTYDKSGSNYTELALFNITGAATLNLYGGTFGSNQKAVYADDGTVTTNTFPVVWVKNAGATVNAYGTTLTVADDANGEAIKCAVDAEINLDGCTIDGGTAAAAVQMDAGTLKLSGVTSIATPGLTLGTDIYANVTNLAAGSTIAVNGVKGQKIAVNGDATKAAMFTAPTGLAVNVDGTDLVLGDPVVEEELPEWDSDIPTRIDQWLGVYADDFTAASAATTKKNVETAICPICGAEDVSWTYRYSNNALNVPTGAEKAHYYLYSDVERNLFDAVGSSQEYPVCVYLNNKTYSTTGCFQVKNTLNIFDDPDVAGGQVLGADGAEKGGNYVSMPLFRLTAATSDLNLYYGEYIGAQPYVTDLNVNGTALIGSSADSGQTYIYGATLQNTHYGEVLRAEHNITVELENCTLNGGSGYVDGEGVTYGGNIYMEDGTVTLKNTTVTGGTATNGSVYVGGGTLKLAGTTSIATNGLTLGADVYADVTDLATTSGAIVVNGTKDQKIAVNGDADKAAMFTAPEGLEVTVDGTDLVLSEPEVVDPGPAYADGDTTIQKINKFTAYYAEKFAAGGTVEAVCPICEGEPVEWTPRNDGQGAITAGHWFVNEDYTTPYTNQNFTNITSSTELACLYLNGKDVQLIGKLTVNNELNIFGSGSITKVENTREDKTSYLGMPMFDLDNAKSKLNIYGGDYKVEQPMVAGVDATGMPVISITKAGELNIYGGTFENTGDGTVLQMTGAGTVTMTGGTLKGGNGYIDGENKLGGNVYISGGTFTLNGGIIGPETRPETNMATNGGNVYVAGGTFTLTSGTIQNGIANVGGNVYVAADGTLTMNNGTITGGKANDTDTNSDGGGNVFNGGSFAMTGGLITLGEAYDGGNVFNYRNVNGTGCTLSGGSITEGVATNGGNLYSRLATTLSGVTISGGKATNGGNLYTRASRITMSGGSVSGGEATNGGNAYIYAGSSSALRLTGGTIENGTATSGGNIYVGGNSATLDLRSGTVTGGVAGVDAEEPTEPGTSTGVASNGGSVYVAEEGIFNMTGGSITGGTVYPRLTAKADGSGITVTNGNGGSVYVAGTLNMSNGTITGGTARDARGSGVYVNGKAYLSGGTIHGTADVTDSALHVTGGSSLVSLSGNVNITADNGKAIRVISSGTLNIEPTWSGKAYAMIYSSAGWDMGAKIGKTENEVFTRDYVQSGTYTDGVWSPCGEGNYFSGSLYQYTNNGSKLFALADGSLQAAGGAYVKNGETTWCRDYDATVDEAGVAGTDYDYMWLTGDVTMNGETITVDASGSKDVTLSGTGTVNGIDLANTDYKTNSAGLDIDPLSTETIKVNGEYTFDGKRYIALNQGAWTFHCLDLKLSAITLRPNKDNNNGLYYKSTITCDPMLAGAVEAYGVVLSRQDMPDENFLTDLDDEGNQTNIWTEIDGKNLAIDDTKTTVTVNSAFVKGILKDTREPAKNVAAGTTKIHANGYLAIDTDGGAGLEFYMASNPQSYSLFDMLGAINTNWSRYEVNWDGIGGFYGYWQGKGLSEWDGDLANIAAHAATLQN